MRAGAIASALCAAVLAGGCTTVTPVDVGGTDPVAGWNAETRDLADRTWLYAQLAINAYEDYEAFILPGDIVQRPSTGNDGIGYAYVIFDRFEGDRLAETIIAFRGTEPQFGRGGADVLLGNILGFQHDRGLGTAIAVYDQLQSLGYTQTEVSVTGHSLGGAIAHHVTDHALDDNGGAVTRSIVFNNAPRLVGFDDETLDRIAAVERGDFVGPLRAIGSAPPELHYSIDCEPGFSPGRDHGMRQLAECLTWIAAYDTPQARLSLAQNPVVEMPGSQESVVTPVPDETSAAGVPINPYVADPALARAVDARLRASETLSPHYGVRVGYRLELVLEGGEVPVEARWVRNGVLQLQSELSCRDVSVDDCAAQIVSGGETLIAAQLAAAD